jgi:hypothetical protein
MTPVWFTPNSSISTDHIIMRKIRPGFIRELDGLLVAPEVSGDADPDSCARADHLLVRTLFKALQAWWL